MAQLLQNKVRALVSKKKHRMSEDGFDLDLTYVTPRIIAMGIPSVDYQKMYRNRIEDVERFPGDEARRFLQGVQPLL